MDEALLGTHVDELYGVDRSDFVAERDRRVTQLRADGHREEATALGRRRKPTLAAWAVDQAARRDGEVVDDLLDAGMALHDAQGVATSGGDADELRRATRDLHRLVDALTDVADGVLAEAGAGSGHRDEVRQTVLAAALDPAMHDELRRGVLERAAEHVGFGVVGALPADGGEDRATEVGRTRARRRELERQRDALQQSLEDERTRADRAEARSDELRLRAERAEADAQEARASVDRVADELAGVEDELGALDGS